MATARWDGQRWRIRVSINGKVRSYSSSIPGRKGKLDVESKAAKGSRLTEIVTFGVAWDRYLEQVKYMTGPDNYINVESIGRNYFLPTLADVKLNTLTFQDFQSLIFSLKKKNGEPLSKKTLSNVRTALVSFAKYCEGSQIMDIKLNLLRTPKNAPRIGKVILQPNESRRLMTEFEDEWYINLWRWLLCTGMRPGEALGLKWSDIENNVVTIKRSRNYRGRETEGKNDNARRAIGLNSILKGILDAQHTRTWRLNAEYIFCDHAGKVSKQTVTKNSWDRIAKELNTEATPYSLRHTFISYMAQDLPEEALKEMIGHGLRMDTYGIYRHAVNGQAERIANMSNEALIKLIN